MQRGDAREALRLSKEVLAAKPSGVASGDLAHRQRCGAAHMLQSTVYQLLGSSYDARAGAERAAAVARAPRQPMLPRLAIQAALARMALGWKRRSQLRRPQQAKLDAALDGAADGGGGVAAAAETRGPCARPGCGYSTASPRRRSRYATPW